MQEQTVLWLPGWGFEPDVFNGIRSAFPNNTHHVNVSWNGLQESGEVAGRARTALAQTDGKVFVVGWSLGALAALELALEIKKNVTRLALFAPTSCFVKMDHYEFGWDERVVRRMQKQLKKNKDKVLADFHERMYFESKDAEVAGDFSHSSGESVQSLNAGLDYLMGTDLRERLTEINQPMLLFQGMEDVICPPEASSLIEEKAGGYVSSVEMPKVGHSTFMTENQSVVRELSAFYKGVYK